MKAGGVMRSSGAPFASAYPISRPILFFRTPTRARLHLQQHRHVQTPRRSTPGRGSRCPDRGHDAGAGLRPAAATAPERARACSDLRDQRAARMRHQTRSVRRDICGCRAPTADHLQGERPSSGSVSSTSARIPAQPDALPRPSPPGARSLMPAPDYVCVRGSQPSGEDG